MPFDLSTILHHVSDVVATLAANTTIVIVLLAAVVSLALKLPLTAALAMLPYRIITWFLRLIGIIHSQERWSIVYDSHTKQPIDPAYVTVRNTLGRIITSAVTDLDGRFGLILDPGIYTIDVQKTNYEFPSKKMQGANTDGTYTGLYFGGNITVEKGEHGVALNIPMDPIRADWNQQEKRRKHLFLRPTKRRMYREATQAYLILLSLLAVGRLYFYNDSWAVALAAICGALLIIDIIAGIVRPAGQYHSAVVGMRSGKPLPFARIHVITAKNHFEVMQKTASIEGQFVCLLPNGKYYVTIDRRTDTGTYEKVSTSSVFRARGGYIGKVFKVKGL